MTGSKETVAATDTTIRRLAYRGRGIVTARAAAAAGVNAAALSRAGNRGAVHLTEYRGVYSVYPPELLSARDRLQAAWTSIDLTSPPWERVHEVANIVSHHTALDLHAGRQPGEPFEFVLGSTSRLINRPGIIAHRQSNPTNSPTSTACRCKPSAPRSSTSCAPTAPTRNSR